jgi:hypothetical protein
MQKIIFGGKLKTVNKPMIKPIILLLYVFLFTSFQKPIWGFFGHKRINRLAVFTLPSDMMPLFKKEIEFISEHAIDPDKRRFVVPTEGFRHYINLDKWAFLPQDKLEAQILHTQIFIITDKSDTLQLVDYQSIRKHKKDYYLKSKAIKRLFGRDSITVADSFYRKFFIYNLSKIQPDDPLSISPDSLKNLFKKEQFTLKGIKAVFAKDRLTQHGILPYHLQTMQRQLTEAFSKKNKNRILKLSAEMGHYLADAHVPLHTTSNYDGQQTQQSGIHAFWESRLPELFADARYDFYVGRATYINKPKEYFWNIISASNKLAINVLQIEKKLSVSFPNDKKYCIEIANGVSYQKPCFEYAEAFHNELAGMVESQMQLAILALGSVWYTAWVDAGQPDLSKLTESVPETDIKKEEIMVEKATKNGGIMIGRDEGKQ